MATKSETTWTHTCDLCSAEHDRKDLRRFGLVVITEPAATFRSDPSLRDNTTCDVCPDCATKPISEVLAILDPPSTDNELADLRQMARGRSARSA